MQVGGIEQAHSAISTATEDVFLADRDAVGHSGLWAEQLRSVRPTFPFSLVLFFPSPQKQSLVIEKPGQGRGSPSVVI